MWHEQKVERQAGAGGSCTEHGFYCKANMKSFQGLTGDWVTPVLSSTVAKEPRMATEHLKCGQAELKCATSIKHILDYENFENLD